MVKLQRQDRKIRRNYIVYERQDSELQDLANDSPELDKSGVLRVVMELGLAEVRRSPQARQLIKGEIVELLAE